MRDPTLTTSRVTASKDAQLEHSLTPQLEDVFLYAPTNHSCTLKIALKAVSHYVPLIYMDKTKPEHVSRTVPTDPCHCRKIGSASLSVRLDSTHTSLLNSAKDYARPLYTEIHQPAPASLPALSTSCSMQITRREHVLPNAPVEATLINGQWPACRAVRWQTRPLFRPTLQATTTPAPNSALSPSTLTTPPSSAYPPVPIPISTISKATNVTRVPAPVVHALGSPDAVPASLGISCRTAPVFKIVLFFTTPTPQPRPVSSPPHAGPTSHKTPPANASHHALSVPLPIQQFPAAMPVPRPV